MRAWLTGALVGAGVVVAAAALGLTAAGVHSPARTVTVLLFLAVGPTAAVAGLLRGMPPATRVIIAFTTDVTIIALIAIVMLSAGLWSPTGGLVAVAVITAACCAAQLPAGRRALVAGRAAVWPGRPGAGPGRPEPGQGDGDRGTGSPETVTSHKISDRVTKA
jgi:hypothetical protein